MLTFTRVRVIQDTKPKSVELNFIWYNQLKSVKTKNKAKLNKNCCKTVVNGPKQLAQTKIDAENGVKKLRFG